MITPPDQPSGLPRISPKTIRNSAVENVNTPSRAAAGLSP
jgi:hypothetical protein